MTTARIDAGGPQRYDGPRLGQAYAVRRVALHSIARAVGLRRGFGAKVLPLFTLVVALLPAVVLTGLAILLPDVIATGDLPSYPDYYGFILTALLLFSALVAPELLCTDRRSGLLGLYFAAPLDRRSYLGAKLLAALPLLSLITLVPVLVLLLGLASSGAGPAGLGDTGVLLLRMFGAAAVLSATFAAVSLAIASLTDRRAVAAVGVVLFLLASGALSAALVQADAPVSLQLLDVTTVSFETVQRIYAQPGQFPGLPTWQAALGTAAWVVGPLALLWNRYARVEVTR